MGRDYLPEVANVETCTGEPDCYHCHLLTYHEVSEYLRTTMINPDLILLRPGKVWVVRNDSHTEMFVRENVRWYESAEFGLASETVCHQPDIHAPDCECKTL